MNRMKRRSILGAVLIALALLGGCKSSEKAPTADPAAAPPPATVPAAPAPEAAAAAPATGGNAPAGRGVFAEAEGFRIENVPPGVSFHKVASKDELASEWEARDAAGKPLARISELPWSHVDSLALGPSKHKVAGLDAARSETTIEWGGEKVKVTEVLFESSDFIYKVWLRPEAGDWVLSGWRNTKAAQTKEPPASPGVTGARPALDDKTLCANSCLLLMEHPFTKVADEIYCQRCKAFDSDACELDWPSSDLMACEQWDRMGNCIYAGFGYQFTKDKWKKEFAAEPWYRPDPGFNPDKLPKVAQDNVAYLKKAAASCRAGR